MDITRLEKNACERGFSFRYFESGADAADYLAEELSGTTVGIGGSKTVESIGLAEKLEGRSEVFWHWRQSPNEARAKAAVAEAYVASANGISETGEIVNIDGAGNRVASLLFGHKRIYVVAGINKIRPDLESAIHRARNIAAPLNARRFGVDTPCCKGELKCWDCKSPKRICRGMEIIMGPMMGVKKFEIVIIGEELGY